MPVENLVTPELVRRLCWDWSAPEGGDVESAIDRVLAAGGARPWQRMLTVPVLASALLSAAEQKGSGD